MKGKWFSKILILALISVPFTGLALDPGNKITQYIHDNWGLEDGPVSMITSLIQTRDGYLRLGTEEGLVRFDGVRFNVYNKANSGQTAKDGLCNNLVTSIHEDREGNLWIGTEGGLNCLNDGKLTSYSTGDGLSHNWVSSIHQDREGRLWIGTLGGLNRFKNGRFLPDTTRDGFPGIHVTSMDEDRDGCLWIGTRGGVLNRRADGELTLYTIRNGLSDNWVSCIHVDREGNVWIGTRGAGLNRLRDGKFTLYTTKDGLSHNWVSSIHEDREGRLWIGTLGGLNRRGDRKFTSYTTKEGLSDDAVYAIHEDREGCLWIGTAGGGLDRLKDRKFTSYTTKDGLSHNRVSSIHEGRDGVVWVGTLRGGLNRLEDGKFTKYTTKNGFPHNTIYAIHEDRGGNLWIGTEGGLIRMCEGTFSLYTTKEGLADNRVFTIHEDRKRNLWIGTFGGLNRLRNGTFKTYTTKEGLSSDLISIIHEDPDENLWIGTFEGGLNLMKDGKFISYGTEDGLSGNHVTCIYSDKEENLWIGTKNGGLNRLKNGKFKTVTSRQGLPTDSINLVLEDGTGNLWFGGNKGVFRVSKQELDDFFSGKRNRVASFSYNENDGMKNRKITGGGTWPMSVKDRDGKLRFPTLGGMVVVQPNRLRLNRVPPPVVIESMVVDNKKILYPFNPDGAKILFPPGSERLEIHYTGLSFPAPERVRFKCKLEGFETGWYDMGTERTAYYTKLPPGDYTFRVTACNNDGIWNEEGASISFYLRPYFHQTPWFYLLCALAAGLTGFTGYRLRVRQLKSQKKKLTELVELHTLRLKEQSEKLKEMNNVKSRFFADISHEFRTPLTLILGPMEQMITACPDHAEEENRKLTLMYRNARRLLRLINQLLELSKLDSGKMKLQAAKLNIISFVKGVTASFQLPARQKELDLVFHAGREGEEEAGEIFLYIDPRKMEDIMTNLLVNALKFTPGGGKVTVTVYANPSADENFPAGSVEISVCDTGPGIPGEQSAHIFDRFFQADSTCEYHRKGSGIGLALSKELVELHRGTITVESGDGKGSTFTVRLPIGSTHLAPGEIADTLPGEIPGIEARMEAGEAENETGSAYPIQPEAAGEKKDIILVVEDSADLREYIRGALGTCYTVVEAGDGEEGIQKAREIIPDLIISDVLMPKTDGYELCRTLKNHVHTSHVPIILLTAKASEENILRGLETGADDYITKPFSTDILRARLKNLIDLRSCLQRAVTRETIPRPAGPPVSKVDQRFLNDLKDVINKNLSDSEFSVDELCKGLYMSRATLYRKVQALSGLTPNRFIQSYRLKRAAELLKQNSRTVQDVAFDVGFGSSSYFSKCFKETFHLLPSEYQSANHR